MQLLSISSRGLGLGRSALEPLTAAYISLGGIRHKITRATKTRPRRITDVDTGESKVEGIKYVGFTYFPRDPKIPDPPYEPSKLFAVRRIRDLRRLPYWDKRIVEKDFKLHEERTVTIVKNTPVINAKLWKVKHLVKITPITFPNGFPKDINSGYLKENGEFVQYDTLKVHDKNVDAATAEQDVKELKTKSVDGETLRHRLRVDFYNWWT